MGGIEGGVDLFTGIKAVEITDGVSGKRGFKAILIWLATKALQFALVVLITCHQFGMTSLHGLDEIICRRKNRQPMVWITSISKGTATFIQPSLSNKRHV